MPTCENCGEDQFDCVDGLYFCSECQTQTQDLQEEVQEEVDLTGISHSRITSSAPAREKPAKTVDKGRPWRSVEGFQIIIKEQVKRLIQMGAPTTLEDAVLRLWMRYLNKTGVAFFDPEEKRENLSIKYYPRPRDVAPSTLEDPEVKAYRYRQKYNEKHSTGARVRERNRRAMENAELRQTLGDEEFYEDDDPLLAESSDDEEKNSPITSTARTNTTVAKEIEESEEEDVRVRQEPVSGRYHSEHISRMSLIRTLCFSYLGLIYSGCLVTIADLIKWVRAGDLPYNKATHLFPEDMKFHNYDYVTFCFANVPYQHRLRLEIENMMKFLELKQLPPVDIHSYISKYLLQLNLPGELCSLVRALFKQKQPRLNLEAGCRFKTLPQLDALAMAIIIFILKLLFGINDHTEVKISAYANDIMKLIPNKKGLFVWTDWMQQTKQRKLMKERNGMPKSIREAYSLHNVRGCIDSSTNVSGQNLRLCVNTKKYKSRQTSTLDALSQPLVELQQKLDREEQRRKTTVAVSSTLLEDSQLSLSNVEHDARSETDVNLSHEATEWTDFTRTSLTYITENTSYMTRLQKQGLSDFTILSSCVGDSSSESSDNDNVSDDDELDPSQDLFLPMQMTCQKKRQRSTPGRKAPKSRRQDKLRDFIHGTIRQDSHEHFLEENQVQLERLLEKVNTFHGQYMIERKSKSSSQAEARVNYAWLLDHCSATAESSVINIENFLERLEDVYIQDDSDLDRASRLKKKNFIKMYFAENSQQEV